MALDAPLAFVNMAESFATAANQSVLTQSIPRQKLVMVPIMIAMERLMKALYAAVLQLAEMALKNAMRALGKTAMRPNLKQKFVMA